MIKRLWALVTVTMVIATACGSDGTDTTTTADTADTATTAETAETTTTSSELSEQSSTTGAPSTTEVDEDFSGDDSNEFCEKAREFDENEPFENVSLTIGPEFFEEAEELYGEVISIAPAEIRDDFESSLDGIRQMGTILEKYDYNFFDEALGAEMDALDTVALDASGQRIDTYLKEVCGIDNVLEDDTPDVLDGLLPEGIDPADLGIDPADLEGLEINPDAAQAIFDQFGLDEELVACLEQELGSGLDLDSAATDPSFMTQEVCGTTILEIISGIGQG